MQDKLFSRGSVHSALPDQLDMALVRLKEVDLQIFHGNLSTFLTSDYASPLAGEHTS